MKTEYEFALPRGYVDSEGNLHKRGWMRLARAKDLLLPLQDPRVQKNQNYTIVILLSRLVTKLGTVKLVNPPVIEGLFAADMAYLMDFCRRINGSNGISRHLTLTCSQCGQAFAGEIDIQGESEAIL